MILMAGLAERRRDLAVLRAAGAAPRQLVVVVLFDALTLGLLGSLCGLALGFSCAAPTADILRESFGWILGQRWMAPELPSVIVGAFASAVIGGLIPARMAYKTTPDDVFGPE
jgi:putative ABC transport system permease protein